MGRRSDTIRMLQLMVMVVVVVASLDVLNVVDAVPSKWCPQVRCSGDCVSGRRVTSEGCNRCQCIDPCEGKQCDPGLRCVRVPDLNCPPSSAPCYQNALCVPVPPRNCPQVRCSGECVSGSRVTAEGCNRCQCVDPCEAQGRPCGPGQRCTRVSNPTCPPTPAPCYQTAKCVQECPMRKCHNCESGFLLDKDGCPSCECVNRCERVTCPTGQVCKVQGAKCPTGETYCFETVGVCESV